MYANDYEYDVTHGQEIMFRLKDSGELFTEKDFYRLARRQGMPPDQMKEQWRNESRAFEEVGYIEEVEGGYRGVCEE